MSWLFSRALVEAFSEDTCSDGEPSAQLNVMPTAQPFSRRGKTIDASDPSPFGLTCAPLTAERGEELWTWCLVASPAPTYPLPAKAPASTESSQACGGTWPGSWVKYDPSSCSWKTAQFSLLGDSASFLGIWPRSGSMRSGMCSARGRRDLSTAANESGSSLPTPSGVNGGRNNTMGRIDEWGGSSNPLRGTVIGSMCLPEFEELVMGWPIGWTALTPYATARFHEWQQQHSPRSLPSSNDFAVTRTPTPACGRADSQLTARSDELEGF
jgi:hypothetical protein